jgi:hypothetical protein
MAEASERLREQGLDLFQSATTAPSYDGQFGPQVLQMGAELADAFALQAQRLADMSARLLLVADSFEEADRESQSAFAALSSRLMDWITESAPFLLPLVEAVGLSGLINTTSLQGQMRDPAPNAGQAASTVLLAQTPTPSPNPTPTSTPAPPPVSEPPRTTTPDPIPVPRSPLPTPSPTAIGTPTAEELWRSWRGVLTPEQAWERDLTREMDSCIDSGGSDDCIIDIGFEVYDHYGINIYQVANARQDNPLPPDSFGFRLLAPRAMVNWNDDLNPAFLSEVGVDSLHPSNYEAAYLETMKQRYPAEFREAVDEVKDNEGFMEYFKKYGFEQIFGSAYEYRPDTSE